MAEGHVCGQYTTHEWGGGGGGGGGGGVIWGCTPPENSMAMLLGQNL
jgi:hypothetical protein